MTLAIDWIREDSLISTGVKRLFKEAKSNEAEFGCSPVRSIEAANRYLQKVYLRRWHRERAVPLAKDAHRPLAADPAHVFSKVNLRAIQPNGSLHYCGKRC